MNDPDPKDPEAPGNDRRSPKRTWLIRIAALAVLGGAAFLLLKPAGTGATELPNFRLPFLFDDGAVSSEDLEGKPVVINFWASWCDPCRREAPMLSEFQTRYQDEGVVILGVNVQDSPMAARDFARKHNLTYPLVLDLDQLLFKPLGSATGLPQTYFVGRDGLVVQEGVAAPKLGELSAEELEAAVAFLLEGSP